MNRTTTALCLTFLLLLPGCSSAPVTTHETKTAGGIKIDITSDPESPHVGDNDLEVNLSDAKTGFPVVDANVAGTVVMTAPQLPGVSTTGRSKGNGLYEIPVSFPTATTYTVWIDIERPGHAAVDIDLPIEAAQ